VLLRRSALEDVGLLDESYFMYWDDADLGFRLRAAGWKLVVASDAKIWHKESASLRETAAELDAAFSEGAARFYLRHAQRPAWPLLFNVVARMTKRALSGDGARAKAVITGTVAGLKDKHPGSDGSLKPTTNAPSS
jgi:GT2 family glycosyltransferase